MYVIENEIFDLIGGGGPAAPTPVKGGGSATSGPTGSSANCPPGTIPIAVSGNVTATIAGVQVTTNGGLASCITVNNGGNNGGNNNGGNNNGGNNSSDSGSGSGGSGGNQKKMFITTDDDE
ncbi:MULTISPECIES: hypothetical protein [unclassified Janthinobacterium]|uniref:hypothetical protein n=1 Tax=unclassified Janthinobacterium TaxID=2610881 RepID=UPI0016186621|nr:MULTISPECIES: hypothetical protein [unclassified Janthinobacterium]MBB5606938.1 hypothetical protein [Janthinobacterium sp. S3T4]MBB5612012.1 hypothetical protein [Janthinobacterium sp. S3M3]